MSMEVFMSATFFVVRVPFHIIHGSTLVYWCDWMLGFGLPYVLLPDWVRTTFFFFDRDLMELVACVLLNMDRSCYCGSVL